MRVGAWCTVHTQKSLRLIELGLVNLTSHVPDDQIVNFDFERFVRPGGELDPQRPVDPDPDDFARGTVPSGLGFGNPL